MALTINKTKSERWLRAYSRFALSCCLWCPVGALMCAVGLALTPKNSIAARIVTRLLASSVGLLFVIMGAYFALIGLSLYYRRIKTTMAGAVFGLSAGLLAGAFSAFIGAVGFWAILR